MQEQELQWDGQNWYRWDGHDWVVDHTVPPPTGGGTSQFPSTVPGGNLDWQVPATAPSQTVASPATGRTRIIAGVAGAVVALGAVAAGAFYLMNGDEAPDQMQEGAANAAVDSEPTEVIKLPEGQQRLVMEPAKQRQRAKDGYFYGVFGDFPKKCQGDDPTQTVVTLPYDTWVIHDQEPAVIQAGSEVRIDEVGIPVFSCSDNADLAVVASDPGTFVRPDGWTGGTYKPVRLLPAKVAPGTWILRSVDGSPDFQRQPGTNTDSDVTVTPVPEPTPTMETQTTDSD